MSERIIEKILVLDPLAYDQRFAQLCGQMDTNQAIRIAREETNRKYRQQNAPVLPFAVLKSDIGSSDTI